MKIVLALLLNLIAFAAICQPERSVMIHFNFDQHAVTSGSKIILDSFLHSSSPLSITKIILYGHCDFVGSNKYNDKLSMKRVDTVKDYLIANNVPENVFEISKGFGKRKPLNQNLNDQERLLNRRVEIFVETKIDAAVIRVIDTTKTMDKTLTEKIKDTSTKAGTNIILKNLNFEGGRHFLLPQSRPALEELLQVMQQNPALEIEIQGHICCEFVLSDGFDEDTRTRNLSVNRAKAIYDYLVQNNINRQRLSYKGFGHQFPLHPEDSEYHKTLNRRVEIKIIKR